VIRDRELRQFFGNDFRELLGILSFFESGEHGGMQVAQLNDIAEEEADFGGRKN
jgi:hypothetical protein